MLTHNIYHQLKPLIPRSLQIILRRMVVLWKRKSCAHVWPIDEGAARIPEGWTGWPDGKRFALVLTHDVETMEGQERCAQLAALEESFGFRSSFNFVAEEYNVSALLRDYLYERGFEIGVHGLYHDKNPFRSKKIFQKQKVKINQYLKEWGSVGYRSPCMYHNLDWIGDLDIEYDSSTFDTDPFEPQPDGVGTIFPFWVTATRNPGIAGGLRSEAKTAALQHRNTVAPNNPINPSPSSNSTNSSNSSNPEPVIGLHSGYVELPYTLPQDHSLFVIMKEKNIDIWKKKLDWIVKNGGMALLITHPDYMNFDGKKLSIEEYPGEYYEEFLGYIKSTYNSQLWNALPKEMARFLANNYVNKKR